MTDASTRADYPSAVNRMYYQTHIYNYVKICVSTFVPKILFGVILPSKLMSPS